MSLRITRAALAGLLLTTLPAHAAGEDFVPLHERSAMLLDRLESAALIVGDETGEFVAEGVGLRIRQCGGYPYHERHDALAGARAVRDDLVAGLRTGLACLAGDGPAGRLHPYHEYQAARLLDLFEGGREKTFQCIEDRMFATAVATSPQGLRADDPLRAQLSQVEHPAVVLDTFRLGGILSRRHDDDTYRTFFGLADEQILEHRSGQPLRPASLHRYGDRASLLFHEVVHWLGHQHGAFQPDLTHLYETCCFGGSDYISDPGLNAAHRDTACGILRDDALWSTSYHPYKQMRVWHERGYHRFKARMRADYDS
jgi:hypothetical protein